MSIEALANRLEERLVDAVLKPDSKFKDYIKNVETELKTINQLRDAGHVAQTADMMDVVTGTGERTSKTAHSPSNH